MRAKAPRQQGAETAEEQQAGSETGVRDPREERRTGLEQVVQPIIPFSDCDPDPDPNRRQIPPNCLTLVRSRKELC